MISTPRENQMTRVYQLSARLCGHESANTCVRARICRAGIPRYSGNGESIPQIFALPELILSDSRALQGTLGQDVLAGRRKLLQPGISD